MVLLSVCVVLLGLYWLIGGIQLGSKPATSGEDLGPLFGIGLQIAGAVLVIIGGILAALFAWLYKRVTHRLKLS